MMGGGANMMGWGGGPGLACGGPSSRAAAAPHPVGAPCHLGVPMRFNEFKVLRCSARAPRALGIRVAVGLRSE